MGVLHTPQHRGFRFVSEIEITNRGFLGEGLENIFTNGLIKGDLNISVMGYTSDSMRLYRVYNKDSTFDYGIPIQEIK